MPSAAAKRCSAAEKRPSAASGDPASRHSQAHQASHLPHGRVLTDDVFSMRFGWLTYGKVPPTGLKPHDDLLAQFPYLGPPNSPPA